MLERVDVQRRNPPTVKILRQTVIPVGPSIAYVELTQGKFALIDSGDVAAVEGYNWRAKYSGAGDLFYARRSERGADGIIRIVWMHSALCPKADHRNGNGLDNRRSANLRTATQSQNNCNRRIQRNNSSGFKGVSWHAPSKRWDAIITANGKRKYLGGFSTPEAAYSAYTQAAAELHGEFARVA